MNELMRKVFLWMALGLLVTFGVGLFVSNSQVMYENIYQGPWYIIFAIVELLVVIFLSVRVMKMKPTTAKCCFLLYSFISGLTFSSIFIYYDLKSIIFVFAISAVFFLLLALLGYLSKVDLSKLGNYFLIGLLVVLIVGIVNIFIGSSTLEFVLSIICVILFIGITIYDVSKLKRLSTLDLPINNLAIMGALDLYLDFINIFIHLFSIFGKSDN